MHPYYLLSRLSFSWVQSCPTLCDPMDCSTPGLPVHYSNSCPLNRWCRPSISSSVIPFSSCLQSFPASGSFPMSQFFTSGGQIIGASVSASVFPMISFRIDWFDLLTVQGTLKSFFQHHSSPGHNTGVGSLSLLQGNFSSQGSNPGLPHCRQILYQLSHKGSPHLSLCTYNIYIFVIIL